MDPRERFAHTEEVLRAAMRAWQASVWTALPGIIQSYDSTAGTVVVQPALRGVVQQPTGAFDAVDLPLLLDVPVVFPSGGGCTLTFPLAEGDECLVVFSSRCIDGWWQSGGVQLPMEPRLHDLSDGFCIPGPRSVPNMPADISADAVQLRSDDGEAYVQLNPTTHDIDVATTGSVNVQADGDLVANVTGDASVTASTIRLVGAVEIEGTLHVTEAVTSDTSVSAPLVTGTTDVIFNGRHATLHKHTGGTISGLTGIPTP